MLDVLSGAYLWVKAIHVMSVLAWMAGLFYLPRLYVYHAERGGKDEPDASFLIMEDKLLRLIMNPAMVSSWLFGLLLVLTPGIVDWTEIWPWTKAVSVLAMTWFHLWLAARGQDFAAGRNRLRGRTYRMMNELPTLLMIVIVLSVIVRW